MTIVASGGQWEKKEIKWNLQTREEIATDNAVFFRFVIEQVGREIAETWIRAYLDGADEEIKKKGDPGQEVTEIVSMFKVERGLTFWPYLNGNKTFNAKDPVNAIFWRHGAASVVADLLENRVGGWTSTHGATFYAYIDDSAHGGTMDWKKFDVQLRKGSFWTKSHHVRIYEGFRPCIHGKSVYSLAGVHEEQFLTWPLSSGCIRGHTPLSWDNARDALETDIQSVPASVNPAVRVNLNSSGTLQNVQHDGHATYIEFKPPHWLASI